jgi:hypothetical protein
MLRNTKSLFAGLTVALCAFSTVEASAEPYNPSPRSLQKMARGADPLVSMFALGDVCPTVKNVTGREFLWKSQISNHIPSSDKRSTGPTFICGKICPTSFPLSFFYSDGSKAGEVGKYGIYNGNGQPRAYCGSGGTRTCSIKRIDANSKISGRDGFLYVKTSNDTCYRVRPLGRTGRL